MFQIPFRTLCPSLFDLVAFTRMKLDLRRFISCNNAVCIRVGDNVQKISEKLRKSPLVVFVLSRSASRLSHPLWCLSDKWWLSCVYFTTGYYRQEGVSSNSRATVHQLKVIHTVVTNTLMRHPAINLKPFRLFNMTSPKDAWLKYIRSVWHQTILKTICSTCHLHYQIQDQMTLWCQLSNIAI